MMDRDFYVSLPSNVSMQEYPKNKQSNYTTILETPLEFPCEYTVCLKDISNFSNFNVPVGQITFENTLFNQLEHREQFITFELVLQNGINLEQFCSAINTEIAKNFLKNEYLIRYKLAHTNDYLEKCHQLNSLKLTQERPCFNVIKKVNKNIETFEIVDKIDSAFKESFENARGAFNPLKQRFVFFDGLEILAKSFDLIIQTAPMLDDLEQEYNKNFFYQDRIELLNKNTYLFNKSTKVPRSIEEKEMPIPLIVTNQLKDSVNNHLISEKKLVENIQIAKISNPIRNEFLPTFKLHSANRVEIAINLGKIKIEGLLANLLNNSIISELNLEKNESFYLPSRIQLTKFIVVYTDIIEPQFYGNVRSPILRTVNIKSQNDENSTFFDNPHYLKINKTRIDTINIQICDLSGKHIQFRDFFSNIQITLHFRKKE